MHVNSFMNYYVTGWRKFFKTSLNGFMSRYLGRAGDFCLSKINFMEPKIERITCSQGWNGDVELSAPLLEKIYLS